MEDRWSYDPRSGVLDVWDSQDNRVQHFDRAGQEGYWYCAQGRLEEGYLTVYGNRPMCKKGQLNADLEPKEVRVEGKKRLEEYLGKDWRAWVEVS